MGPGKAKRSRGEDVTESFWDREETTGIYLTITLRSGQPVRSKGWPWVDQCLRGILGRGDQGKVDKASLLRSGELLVKTKNDVQTEKLMKTTFLGDEECIVEQNTKLNMSRGTIHAPDLMELREPEIVGWLSGFGVVEGFTKWVDGHKQPTPLILLAFNRPNCSRQLSLTSFIPSPEACSQPSDMLQMW